jgi:hypothetical protein
VKSRGRNHGEAGWKTAADPNVRIHGEAVRKTVVDLYVRIHGEAVRKTVVDLYVRIHGEAVRKSAADQGERIRGGPARKIAVDQNVTIHEEIKEIAVDLLVHKVQVIAGVDLAAAPIEGETGKRGSREWKSLGWQNIQFRWS